MAIYMQIDGVKGNVTAQRFEGWIEVHSVSFGMGRGITSATPGHQTSREASTPSFSEVSVSKVMGVATTALFREAVVGTAKLVKFTLVKPGEGIHPYMEYVLSNALVTGYSVEANGGGGFPLENISFNFDKLEMKYTPYDRDHKPCTPQTVGYDLSEGKRV